MKFRQLIEAIGIVHETSRKHAVQGANIAYTLRNWVIGGYIVEYEQKGDDRAKYGERVLETLASELSKKGLYGLSYRSLRLFRQFYFTYPHIWQTLPAKSGKPLLPFVPSIWQTASAKSSRDAADALVVPAKKLVSNLTFSHFVELLKVDEPLKRTFYEIHSIRCNWNVRELKRNIGSLLFDRSALSKDKKTLLKKLKSELPLSPQDIIREPYMLEFLGIPERQEFTESDLETALINHLQRFLMELGRGFCFEARQKRITVNNRHFFIDLVFYHRVLKCHVLIDLKTREFAHEDAGQMNFYLNYFREEQIKKGDNPPVGIVLCTHNDEAEVKYATAGLPNKLFVSRYKLQLPSEKELSDFIKRDLKRIGKGR
jgi:predicted nuclease of restriction endonuclease-like (RecB) superfamily